MIKNTAGQKVGAQLVSATDGSAFTDAVTVAVTVDAGTQATGSVGSGACTHEGNGYHTYAPSQGETNGDLIAFTFTGTGAVPVTVQVYTIAGDAFTRLGAPAGASVSADIAAVKSETAAILVDTGTTLDGKLDTIDTNVDAILADTGTDGVIVATNNDKTGYGLADGAITAAKIATDAITADKIAADAITSSELAASAVSEIQSGLSTLDAAGVRTAVGLASANLDTQLTAIDDYLDTEIAAIKAKTDNLPASPAATGDIPSAASVADAVWDESTTGHTTAGTFGEQVKTDVDAILVDTAEIGAAGAGLTEAGGTGDHLAAVPWNASWDVEVQSEVADALEETIADSIPADGSRPSVKQALYMLTQFMVERSVSSTTVTVRKPDGSTALFTLTLNDATSPTSITRAS